LTALQEDPAAYKFRSDDIIAVLQELSRTFKSELKRIDEEEGAKRHDFDMVQGARANKIKAYEAEIDKKESLSAEKSAAKSEQQGSLEEETTARAADQSFLDELTSTCEDKATLWDQRSKTRAAELTALTEAKGLLVKASEKYGSTGLVDFIQKSNPSFLQIRHSHGAGRVVEFLKHNAKLLKSSSITELVSRLVSSDDHFVKVRQLIKDLIDRLKDDAEAEATQKSFCDDEMKKAVEKRDENTAKMEDASASIDKTKSKIVQLNDSITELGKEIAELYKALNEMTELRKQEKAQNEKTIADSAEGAEAVAQAIVILQQFYAGAFIQAPNEDRSGQTVGDLAPETFEGEYKGKVDASKGIIGMLEVIQSDFTRTNEKTTADEKAAQTEFEEEETRINAEIDTKKKEKGGLESEVKTAESDLTGFKDDLKDATKMHKQALDELDTLKPACVQGEETYEERRAQREKEIAALKEALKLLEEWQG
jgi:chromosome segregation ATPase